MQYFALTNGICSILMVLYSQILDSLSDFMVDIIAMECFVSLFRIHVVSNLLLDCF